MRYALPVSTLIHVALIGGTWLTLNWVPPAEETGVEAVAVDVVSLEEFTSTEASRVQSSATQSLVAAGAEAVEATEAVQPVDVAEVEPADVTPVEVSEPEAAETAQPVETIEPLPLETTEAPPTEVAEATPQPPVEADAMTSSLDVLSATPIPEAVPVEGLTPTTAAPAAAVVAAVVPQKPEPVEFAAIDPVAAVAPELEAIEPIEEQPVPVPLPRPKFLDQKKSVVVEEKPAPKPKPTSAGNGGKSNATVAASATSGGKGASDASGNAAVSRYPGLVQRALRRALRQPMGAGNARGEVQVTFVVGASGSVSGIAVTRSSGYAALDKEAVATVKRAKFPPIPADAGRNSWTFTMPLAFRR